jgi:hypothetical protein
MLRTDDISTVWHWAGSELVRSVEYHNFDQHDRVTESSQKKRSLSFHYDR